MDYKVDYATYTLEDLYEAAKSIDREAYPERASEIDRFIRTKEKQIAIEEPETLNRAGSQASRLDRLFAVIVDALINSLATIPLFYYFGIEPFKDPTLMLTATSILYGFLILAVMHGYLIYQYGQTIGKHLMSIRIENLDGTKADWKTIVFLRMLPMGVMTHIPFWGVFIAGLVNPLFIFGKEQRCLHDYIAKTKVSYTSS